VEGVPVIKDGEIIGLVNRITDNFTAYTFNNILYYDYIDGYTLFITGYSDPTDPQKIVPIMSGITEEMISLFPIVKEEVLIGMVNGTEIQSSVFIDRGKLSGTESILRLGEIDSMNDLINYGYGYFKI
jgi:predicted transcriptional regulator